MKVPSLCYAYICKTHPTNFYLCDESQKVIGYCDKHNLLIKGRDLYMVPITLEEILVMVIMDS
jgi:hypothetical protein